MDSLSLVRQHLRQLSRAPPAIVRRPPAQLTYTATPNSKLRRKTTKKHLDAHVHTESTAYVTPTICVWCVCVCTFPGDENDGTPLQSL